MGDKVIRFPTERRLQAAAKQRAETSQAVPAPTIDAEGQPFALLSLEVRRLPRIDSRIDGEVAGRILNRCVLAALEAMSKDKTPVDLAGTVLRPVIEAAFHGPNGATRAARAAVAAKEAIGRVQREVENEFHVFAAITTGTTAVLEDGINVTTGLPDQVAARFREHAAPGQILLAESAWEACREDVDVSEPALPVTIPGGDPVPGYALLGIR